MAILYTDLLKKCILASVCTAHAVAIIFSDMVGRCVILYEKNKTEAEVVANAAT